MKNNDNITAPLPVTVRAPIITDALTNDGVKPLLDFIDALEQHSNIEVAQAENERLTPYFRAVSRYLQRIAYETAETDEKAIELQDLSSPGALAGLFNAAARQTHNTILSDVAILPSDIVSWGPAYPLFQSRQFKVNYEYDGHTFNFGFLQVYEGGYRNGAESSTAFPTFMLDSKMMNAIAPHEPLELLREFQGVISFVNHDMLHHFTTPIINPAVAQKFRFEDVVFQPGEPDPIHAWYRRLPQKSRNDILYEEWAQMSHESALLAPGNEAQVEELTGKVTKYFQHLKRMGEEIARDEGAGKAHKAVDYFGMVMAHALTRVFPLNHPLMTHCIDSLQKADPGAAKFLKDAERSIAGEPSKIMELYNQVARFVTRHPPAHEESLTTIRRHAEKSPTMTRITEAYKQIGFDVLPQSDAAVGYRNIKMLQLIRFTYEDLHPHVPVPLDPAMAEMRKKTGKALLDMVAAAGKSFGYAPKQ
ncbi:MAG: hypothetical protein ACAH83_09965 [Alphaproteobacteria bacterium]